MFLSLHAGVFTLGCTFSQVYHHKEKELDDQLHEKFKQIKAKLADWECCLQAVALGLATVMNF
jgi:hypothetical protein